MRPRRDRRVRSRRLNISLPPNRPLRNGARWPMSFRAGNNSESHTLRFNQFGAEDQWPDPPGQEVLLHGDEGQRRAESPLYSSFTSIAPTIPDALGPVHPASMRSSGRNAWSRPCTPSTSPLEASIRAKPGTGAPRAQETCAAEPPATMIRQ